jgi:hypothetical protein
MRLKGESKKARQWFIYHTGRHRKLLPLIICFSGLQAESKRIHKPLLHLAVNLISSKFNKIDDNFKIESKLL